VYGMMHQPFTRERFTGGRSLVLFLGSNIGNFDPPCADAMLQQIRATLAPGDAVLIGADLVKPEGDLLLAYDDPLGVTRAFNLNLLARINRELGGDFDLGGFRHRALWNGEASRIEMHLVSVRTQRIRVPAAQIDLMMNEGDAIWTESSYKYRPDEVVQMLERSGFRRLRQWVEPSGQFALTLVEAAEMGRYGVTANAIAPAARTRMTEEVFADRMQAPASGFDVNDPANISPLVVWLGSSESGDVTGRVFEIEGGLLSVADGWQHGPELDKRARWEPSEVGSAVRKLLVQAPTPAPVYGAQ